MSEEILRKAITIEIEGVTYTIRRPGLTDCFALARILATVQIHAGHAVDDFYEPVPITDSEGNPILDKNGNPKVDHKINAVALVFSLASGIPEAEDDVIGWVASMLIKPDGEALTIDEARNPDILPLMELPPLIEKLVEVPDIPAFFSRSVQASTVVRGLWESRSGRSKDRQAGRTPKSAGSHTQGSQRSGQQRRSEHTTQPDNS